MPKIAIITLASSTNQIIPYIRNSIVIACSGHYPTVEDKFLHF